MRTTVRLVLFLMLVATMPLVVHAQYTVHPGDTLWELAGKNLGRPEAWEKIYAANPFLHEEGRRFIRNGVPIVLIRPGEKLAGLDEMGVIIMRVSDTQHPQLVAQLPIPHSGEANTSDEPTTKTSNLGDVPTWFWWGSAVIFLLSIAAFVATRQENVQRGLNQNPVTSGPPLVPGGVTNATAPARFQAMAAHQYTQTTGRTAMSPEMFTILRSTPGRGWGIMDVTYADNRTEPRRLNGERVYEAEVRFPDGVVETLHMLQGCGNDLKFGKVQRYQTRDDFRFEADTAAEPVPSPAPAPTVEVATPQVIVPEVATEKPPVVEDGLVRIEVRRATSDKPAMVRMTGIDGHGDAGCEIKDNEIVIRFTPRGTNPA